MDPWNERNRDELLKLYQVGPFSPRIPDADKFGWGSTAIELGMQRPSDPLNQWPHVPAEIASAHMVSEMRDPLDRNVIRAYDRVYLRSIGIAPLED